jgi:hypothetical protein
MLRITKLHLLIYIGLLDRVWLFWSDLGVTC